MCTIVMVHGVHPAAPLVIAANRDELYNRDSAPPSVLSRTPPIIAGRDLQRAGTWLGATPDGFFAGLTNQRTHGPSDRSKRSRGEVVTHSLSLGDTDAVERYLRALEHPQFNPFNLAFGRAGDLRVAYVRATGCEIVPLGDGVHVLANDVLRSPHFPKIDRAETLTAASLDGDLDASFAKLTAMLSDHEMPSAKLVPKGPPGGMMPHALLRRLQALCIHTPVYGTVSSTLLALTPARTLRYLYADGAPCKHPMRDVSDLLRAA